jgi:ribosome-binding protein aMBF1 (putative translation factor)
MSMTRELRQKRGLSIVALSHEIKANPTVISLAERRRLAPSKNVREAVSNFFAVPECQLFDKEGFAI